MNYALLATIIFLVVSPAGLILLTAHLRRRGTDALEFDPRHSTPRSPRIGVDAGDAGGPNAGVVSGVPAGADAPPTAGRTSGGFVHGVRLLDPGERVLREMERS